MLPVSRKIAAALIMLSFSFYGHCEEPLRFFDGDIEFFEMERGCSDCPPDRPQRPDAARGGPSTGTEEKPGRTQTRSIELICFITLDSPHTEKAVAELSAFRDKHPDVYVRGVVLLPLAGAGERIKAHRHIWETNIPFDIDFALGEARAYRITEVPAFVFTSPDRSYKIAGQPDLTEIYSTAFPLDKNL